MLRRYFSFVPRRHFPFIAAAAFPFLALEVPAPAEFCIDVAATWRGLPEAQVAPGLLSAIQCLRHRRRAPWFSRPSTLNHLRAATRISHRRSTSNRPRSIGRYASACCSTALTAPRWVAKILQDISSGAVPDVVARDRGRHRPAVRRRPHGASGSRGSAPRPPTGCGSGIRRPTTSVSAARAPTRSNRRT